MVTPWRMPDKIKLTMNTKNTNEDDLTLSQAANLITQISGHHIDRQKLWHQAVNVESIKYKKKGNRIFITRFNACKFAEKYKDYFKRGTEGGRKKGSKDSYKRTRSA